MVAASAKNVPQGEAMMVARLGRRAEGRTRARPSIDEKTTEVGLIACSSQQSTHLRLCAQAHAALVISIVDIDKLGTHVEALESIALVACHEELVAVAQGITTGIVGKLVVARTDHAGAELSRLMRSECPLIGELGAARSPREEGDLHGVAVLGGTTCDGDEQEE